MAKLFILLAVYALSYASNASETVLNTCTSRAAYEPDSDAQVLRTSSLKALNHLVTEAGFELSIAEHMPLKRCLLLLKEGNMQVKAGLIFTAERQRDFIMLPYAKRVTNELYVLKDKKIDLTTDNTDLSIAVTQHYKIPKQFTYLSPYLVRVESIEKGFDLVLNNKVDGFLGSKVFYQTIEYLPRFRDQFTPVDMGKTEEEYYYLAITKSAAGLKIATTLQKTITLMTETGELQRFYN